MTSYLIEVLQMLESTLLVISLCIDSGLASFAYGTNKIKIPILSAFILTLISTLFLLFSISIGNFVKTLFPTDLTKLICFLILFLLGFLRLFEGILKKYLNKKAVSPNAIELSFLSFKVVLNVYADATVADLDHSYSLSSKEALYLGIALSLDSIVVGFGAALASIQFVQITLLSIVFNLVSIIIGATLGHKCANSVDCDLSWLSGVMLIILAIIKFI